MPDAQAAALVYAGLTLIVALFQVGLALGAPWGEAAMGGAIKGAFPPRLRVAAVVQIAILAALAGVVLSRAGLALPEWRATSQWLVWGVVGFGALGVVLNLITRSRLERRIWAPVAVLLFASALLVALAP